MMFCGLDFQITPDVLRPYKATERLVSEALKIIKDIPNPRICDVGTGSGNVVISILAQREDATAVATDISIAALAVARRNALRHGMAERIRFAAMDALTAIDGRFDLVTCNPNYSVTFNEVSDRLGPRIAFTDGKDGMTLSRAVIRDTRRGPVLLECYASQADELGKTVNMAGRISIVRHE